VLQAIPVEQIKTITMSIYRYDPTVDEKPYMQDVVVEIPTDKDIMVLRCPSSSKTTGTFSIL